MIVDSKVKIFYADDDEDDRFVFKSALTEVNHPVELTCFNSGHELENMLVENNFDCDLVFLDLNMPGRDGFETLESLQIPIKAMGLKVIIFTTSGDYQIIRKTHLGNAVLFVQKPVDFSVLVNTLEDIIISRNKLQLPVLFQNFQFNLNNVKNLYQC